MTPEQELERLRRELAEAKKKVSQYRNQEKMILNKARDKERRFCWYVSCTLQPTLGSY